MEHPYDSVTQYQSLERAKRRSTTAQLFEELGIEDQEGKIQRLCNKYFAKPHSQELLDKFYIKKEILSTTSPSSVMFEKSQKIDYIEGSTNNSIETTKNTNETNEIIPNSSKSLSTDINDSYVVQNKHYSSDFEGIPTDNVVAIFGYGSAVFNQSFQNEYDHMTSKWDYENGNVIADVNTHKDPIKHYTYRRMTNVISPEELPIDENTGAPEGVDPISGFDLAKNAPKIVKDSMSDSFVKTNTMTDLIIVVDDVYEFHKQNIRKNFSHYSFLKFLGPSYIASHQSVSTGVYFNTGLRLKNGVYCKYAVVSLESVCNDLDEWNELFIAGRMHKPIALLYRNEYKNTEMFNFLQSYEGNLRKALAYSLYALPRIFTDFDLFQTICNISMKGDVRNSYFKNLLEKKDKVNYLVFGQFRELENMYMDMLKEEFGVERVYLPFEEVPHNNALKRHYEQTRWSREDQARLYNDYMPDGLKRIVEMIRNKAGGNERPDEPRLNTEPVKLGLMRIVYVSSKRIALRSFWTAGPLKSFVYGLRKIIKTTFR